MRRVIFYLFFDPDGRVDDYVLHALRGLRTHAERIVVMSNTVLDDTARGRLESVADDVWERENVGFDVWAYKEALIRVGERGLAQFDELIMMNHTFFGPIGSFDPLFAELDTDREVDFWGVTDHGEVVPHPFRPEIPVMHRHIQSHWIAVRRSLFDTDAFRRYWADMPMIVSYNDSIDRHEARFTHHFEELGFRSRVAFPESDYPSMHPIFDNSATILRDGCPIVKRRTFFHDPLYLDRRAIIGRELVDIARDAGYPVEFLYSNLARTSTPRDLATNLGLLEVMPDVDLGFDASTAPRVVVVAHVFYPVMTDEILDRADLLPVDFDLVITTTSAEKQAEIRELVSARGRDADVRIVASNRGRDVSAFFIGCRDVLEGDAYDLVVKLHSKKSPQDGLNQATLFKRHLFENLLSSRGYAANVLRLFQLHPSLGMVFPPAIHMGYPTLGHAWFGARDDAKAEARRIGLTVPFDEFTPLAAYGSMFIARPEAIRSIAAAGYEYDDFPGDTDYRDGTLSHVLERLVAYASLSAGYHVREVLNPEFAAIYYTSLEYKLQAISARLPAHTDDQIAAVGRLMGIAAPPPLAVAKAVVTRRAPRLSRLLAGAYRPARRLYHTAIDVRRKLSE